MVKSHPDHSCAILSVAAVLAASLLFGIILGGSGPAIDTMKNEVLDFEGHVLRLPDSHNLAVFNATQANWYCAIVAVGALIGALFSGAIGNAIGFRYTMMSTVPMYLCSWFIMGYYSNVWLLYVSRAVTGLAVGINSFVVPTYISEISPIQLRGFLGACNQLCVVIGVVLVYFMGMYFTASGGYIQSVLGVTEDVVAAPANSFCDWRKMALINIIPTLLLGVGLVFIPESPCWLASKGMLRRSIASLRLLRGGTEGIDKSEFLELDKLYRSRIRSRTMPAECSLLERLYRSRKQVFIGIMLQVFQQFSGIFAIIFYCTSIIRTAQLRNAPNLSVYVMSLVLPVTAMSCLMIDRVGRRKLLITGASNMAIACCAMGLFFAFKQSPPGNYQIIHSIALSVGGLMLYMGGYSLGVGSVPWVMMGELFPSDIRTAASSIAMCVYWGCAFLVTFSMPWLVTVVGYKWIMWMFGVNCLLLVGFTIAIVPETKNKSFLEIQKMFIKRPRYERLVDGEETDAGPEIGHGGGGISDMDSMSPNRNHSRRSLYKLIEEPVDGVMTKMVVFDPPKCFVPIVPGYSYYHRCDFKVWYVRGQGPLQQRGEGESNSPGSNIGKERSFIPSSILKPNRWSYADHKNHKLTNKYLEPERNERGDDVVESSIRMKNCFIPSPVPRPTGWIYRDPYDHKIHHTCKGNPYAVGLWQGGIRRGVVEEPSRNKRGWLPKWPERLEKWLGLTETSEEELESELDDIEDSDSDNCERQSRRDVLL